MAMCLLNGLVDLYHQNLNAFDFPGEREMCNIVSFPIYILSVAANDNIVQITFYLANT